MNNNHFQTNWCRWKPLSAFCSPLFIINPPSMNLL